jgi:hypothetical protein
MAWYTWVFSGIGVAIVTTALGWLTTRKTDMSAGESAGVIQHVRAGRDANTAGRDQTVVNYRRPDE